MSMSWFEIQHGWRVLCRSCSRNLDRFIVSVSGGKLIIDTGSVIESPRAGGMSVKYPQGLSCITIAETRNKMNSSFFITLIALAVVMQ